MKGRETMAEFHEKRKEFERYPIFLKHTLIHGKDFDRVRNAAFANAFFAFDDIKTEGNLYYEDKDYYKALDLYEQAYSCFNWLEFKKPEKREALLNFTSFEKIFDEDIQRKDKDYHGDECEIDTRLNALHNILLNMCCCYMQMSHFKEALAACDEIIRLTDQSSEAYWRRSQVRMYNYKSTFADLQKAEQDIEASLKKKPDDQKYLKHKELLIAKRKKKLEDDINFIKGLLTDSKSFIEYKRKRNFTPEYTEQVGEPQEITVMRVMKRKYADVVEFFRDTEDKQLPKVLPEFQQFSQHYQQMMRIYKFDPAKLDPDFIAQLPDDLKEMLNDPEIVNDVKHRKIHTALAMFGEANLNFALFKYALDIVFTDEKKKKEREKKKKEEEDKKNKKQINAPTRWSKIVLINIFVIAVILVLWCFFKTDNFLFKKSDKL